MHNVLTQTPVPANCEECRATCSFKKAGCAFDAYLEADGLKARVKEFGVDLNLDVARGGLERAAGSCWNEIKGRIEEQNNLVEVAVRVAPLLKVLLSSDGQSLDTKVETIPQLGGGNLNGHAKASVAVVETPVAEDSNEEAEGVDNSYVFEGDEEIENEVRGAEGITGICTTIRMKLDNFEDHVENYLKPAMADEPFEGLVAAIPRRHENNPNLVRVTAYYRGPPAAEASALLKERKARLQGA